MLFVFVLKLFRFHCGSYSPLTWSVLVDRCRFGGGSLSKRLRGWRRSGARPGRESGRGRCRATAPGTCAGAGAARGSPDRWLHKAWFKISKLWKGKHALELEVSWALLLQLCLPQHEESTGLRQGCPPGRACLPRPAAIPARQGRTPHVQPGGCRSPAALLLQFCSGLQLWGAWSSCDSRGAAAVGGPGLGPRLTCRHVFYRGLGMARDTAGGKGAAREGEGGIWDVYFSSKSPQGLLVFS